MDKDDEPPDSLPPAPAGRARHPLFGALLFGALKGLATVPPEFDPMQPADPDWGNTYNRPDRD